MKLSRNEFETRYAEGTLRIAFIGMSNIGKSYTAMRLATRFDFDLIEVDKFIWEELGHSDMDAFAAWQGQPYSEGYAEREAKSIALEKAATTKALNLKGKNLILDTTGSVIYTGESVLEELQKTHYIVYIEASDQTLERLKVQYFKQPKPLIWNDHFIKRSDQTIKAAILDSYPKLLVSRSKAYAALADQTLSSEFILNGDTSIKDVFEALKPSV